MNGEDEATGQQVQMRSGPGRWRRFRAWVTRFWQRLHPAPLVRQGATAGVLLVLALVAATGGAALRPGFGLLDVPVGVVVGLVIAALIGLGVYVGTRLLLVMRDFLAWAGLAGLGALVIVLVMLDLPFPVALLVGLFLGFVEALLGGALAFALRGGLRTASRGKQAAVVLILAAGIAVNVALAWFLAMQGSSEHLVKAPVETAKVAPLDAPDPAQRGAYNVLTLTYGSGDARRPEFGARASLKTESVDASPFVKGNEGFKMKARKWFWGFDPKYFPRNGRVWYPGGKGPFPLVLIVHGNHDMEEYSDPGYAYLAEHLAGRGFIAVSVDENFFNGSWAGGLENENKGRAWMLLQHIKLWQSWNAGKGNPFSGKVDIGNIALIGHSRGGEAVAIASAFNGLKYFPDDATVAFDFNFAIKSIVAIAPSDGQYSPAGHPTPIENVNYLLLQGGHDSDVSVFMGARQFQRVRFAEGSACFKASVYAYRANHGQFNTVWGANDMGWPQRLLLNHRPLLAGDEQRRLGKVVITAFLEATLRAQKVYTGLFRDLRRGRSWLPEDIYVTRYVDSSFRLVANYEEDVDVTTATLPGATIEGHNLAVWREQRLPFRKGESRQNGVAYVGWREKPGAKGTEAPPPSYAISLPEGTAPRWRLGPTSVLAFSAAVADEEPPEHREDTKTDKQARPPSAKPKAKEAKPTDFSVELVDGRGAAARLPLSHFKALVPPLKARFTKLPDEGGLYGKEAEPVLQGFELPLASFAAVTPGFDVATVKAIRFVFDRTPSGVVILDDVGFADALQLTPPSAGVHGVAGGDTAAPGNN